MRQTAYPTSCPIHRSLSCCLLGFCVVEVQGELNCYQHRFIFCSS
uniref:Uncharacterized protein n=1 Tax=Anguilla anguilla TaxID=7936 RepID=A0A0E9PVH2_ANGAN